MPKKYSHITFFLALLISVSLSLSTVHFHKSIEHQVTPEANTSTTIDVDSTLCPICAYLFNADISSPNLNEATLDVLDEVPIVSTGDYISPSFVRLKGRSPPVLA